MKHVLLSLYNKNVHKISMLSTTLIDAFLPIALVRCCILEKYASCSSRRADTDKEVAIGSVRTSGHPDALSAGQRRPE